MVITAAKCVNAFHCSNFLFPTVMFICALALLMAIVLIFYLIFAAFINCVCHVVSDLILP